MLQRSPSYIHAEPDEDSIAKLLRRFLPEQWAYRLIRWKNIRQEKIEYDMTRKDRKALKRTWSTLSAKPCLKGLMLTRILPRITTPGTSAFALRPMGISLKQLAMELHLSRPTKF